MMFSCQPICQGHTCSDWDREDRGHCHGGPSDDASRTPIMMVTTSTTGSGNLRGPLSSDPSSSNCHSSCQPQWSERECWEEFHKLARELGVTDLASANLEWAPHHDHDRDAARALALAGPSPRLPARPQAQ